MDQEETKRRLNDIGHAVNERLPEGYGFFVMVFPFRSEDSRANYVSNSQRQDVINVMKEWLIKAGAAEDWMKDID